MSTAENKSVLKPSGAVQVVNVSNKKFTLMQRKAWNILIFNCLGDFTQETHSIALSDLRKWLGRHDLDELKGDLRGLMTLAVEWNYLQSRDKIKWEATTLLSEAVINEEDNKLYYSFGKLMRSKLSQKDFYAQISLLYQKRINSKAGLVLYELAKDHYIEEKKSGYTPYIPIETLKMLFECADVKSYQQYKEFNRTILKRAITEVNTETDITIRAIPKIKKKVCVAIRFMISPKKKEEIIERIMQESSQSELPFDGNKTYSALVEEHRLSPSQAKEIVTRCTEDFIRATIAYVTKMTTRDGFVGNPTAYLYTALTKGYDIAPPPTQKKPAKNVAEEREALNVRIDGDYFEYRTNAVDEYLATLDEQTKEAILKIFEEGLNNPYRNMYKDGGLERAAVRQLFNQHVIDGYLKDEVDSKEKFSEKYQLPQES